MVNEKTGKIVGAAGGISGAASILGSWQVCHSICLGMVSILAFMGIAVSGLPFLFLTKIAKPFWIAAVVLLIITIVIYLKKRCISEKLLLFNSGLIIAGFPLSQSNILWIAGGLIALSAIIWYIKSRMKK